MAAGRPPREVADEDKNLYIALCGVDEGEHNIRFVVAVRQEAAEYLMAEYMIEKYKDRIHPKTSLSDFARNWCFARKVCPIVFKDIEDIIVDINSRQADTYNVIGMSLEQEQKLLRGGNSRVEGEVPALKAEV